MINKNYFREAPSFANINLLGKCNADCYFCLGKDIKDLLSKHNQQHTHFTKWKNFQTFLQTCKDNNISKLYITGQNTDSLLYHYLKDLILYLKDRNFTVGLRTNGYLALSKLSEINLCQNSVGYSVPSLNPSTALSMMGVSKIPDWNTIIPSTNTPRVQIVITRHNVNEFFDLIKYLSKFDNIRYIQARRMSTDTRYHYLKPDIDAYEELYTKVASSLPLHQRLWQDAEEYLINNKRICFWRTVKTSVNSFNYFTDGTCSNEYFVVEGYLKNYLNY